MTPQSLRSTHATTPSGGRVGARAPTLPRHAPRSTGRGHSSRADARLSLGAARGLCSASRIHVCTAPTEPNGRRIKGTTTDVTRTRADTPPREGGSKRPRVQNKRPRTTRQAKGASWSSPTTQSSPRRRPNTLPLQQCQAGSREHHPEMGTAWAARGRCGAPSSMSGIHA